VGWPRIVVLDGYTLNPGDLDWEPLRALGECAIFDRTPAEAVLERAAGASAVLTNKTPLPRTMIESLPELRYIGVLATGYNIVDTAAASAHDVAVTNVPGYGTASVAQHVFALLLELTQHAGHHAQTVREGRWCASPDFCYWDTPLVELAGRTLGVIGYGSIGEAVARIARAFEMKVIAATRRPRTDVPGVEFLAINDVFCRADVVTLHCPLMPETQGLVNAARLALMKPDAFLINTGRGSLVVEQDLADALNASRLAGAGLDVLSAEPPTSKNPLLSAKNCLITPHIAWATHAARERLLGVVVENLSAFFAGTPQNVVNS
jgi:glycerate dehydrogenase